MKQTFKLPSINYTVRKRVPIVHDGINSGYTTEPDHQECIELECDIDLNALSCNMGWKAAGNKTGKSRSVSGAVIVRVTKRIRTDEDEQNYIATHTARNGY